MIDNLKFVYDTASQNRLLKVNDLSNSPQGFKDNYTSTANDFTYDNNGNMTADNNKGIVSITYNHLNLPIKLNFGAKGNIYYLYNAIGGKVKKVVEDNVAHITTTTDYLSGFQYLNTELQFFPHAEGYVHYTKPLAAQGGENSALGSFNYVFNYTDHLGNVRVSFANDPLQGNVLKILEENHYYAFGLKHKNYNVEKLNFEEFPDTGVEIVPAPAVANASYNYKYNGKELQEELGLNFYDYGARNYDPAIGRWMNVDPLAEQTPDWNPYAFCNNNPLFYIDPTGMSAEDNDWHPDKNGNLVADKGDSTKSLAEYQGISYGAAAKQLKDNGYTINDKGTLNLDVGDAVNTGSHNIETVEITGSTNKKSGNFSTPWMNTASSQVGVKEIFGSKHNLSILNYHATTGGFNNDETAWCSSFVNWTLKQNDIKGTNSAMAMSWKKWGQNLGQTPAYGSVAVFSYGGGKGHVGFVAGQNASGKLIILGGNQSDQVKYSAFGRSQISGFMYPKGHKPNYTLPTMSVNGNTSFKSTR